ncbi:hypothetical protein [Saccharothrix lopnurensis]|uniref:Uncharacterized protein n=1 Tax=Saccharothrix lopnurensis TaxID=1670621 RepID=A0ABW1P2V0_9PSEU
MARNRELTRLRVALDEAARGEAGAALVAGDAGGDRRVPRTPTEVLLGRVERLGADARHVVRVASVGERSVRHDLLRDLAGMGDAVLDGALREAVRHHVLLVERGEVHAFRHALPREAVHGDLLPGERVRLHAAYADRPAPADGRGAAEALAHHSLESYDLPRALRASEALLGADHRPEAVANALDRGLLPSPTNPASRTSRPRESYVQDPRVTRPGPPSYTFASVGAGLSGARM